MDTVESKVRSILREQLAVDDDELGSEARLVEDLSADSLDTVEVVMACEEEFGIEIPDVDAEQVKTVGQLVSYITERMTGKLPKVATS